MAPSLDLPQVELMNFRVEYVRPRSGRWLCCEAAERARVLIKQDEGLLSKSTPNSDINRQLESICQSH